MEINLGQFPYKWIIFIDMSTETSNTGIICFTYLIISFLVILLPKFSKS